MKNYVFYVGPQGLTPENSERWVTGEFLPDLGDYYAYDIGQVMTAGDYDLDGSPDLVIAAPNMEFGQAGSAGVFYVLFNSSGQGLGIAGHLQWTTAGAVDDRGQPVVVLDGVPGVDEIFAFSVR